MYQFSCIFFHLNLVYYCFKEKRWDQNEAKWTFFSNHGHVYFLLATNENIVVREIASRVGITERSVLGIIHDLHEAGYIVKEKVGRSNHYKILPEKTLRHPLESKVQLEDLIKIIQGK